MKLRKKLIYINLGLLLIYTILIIFVSFKGGRENEINRLVLMASAIFYHILINLILGAIFYFDGKKEVGKAFLLSASVVLLIGFSSCIASVNI